MALDRAESDSSLSNARSEPAMSMHRNPVNDTGFLQADIEWFTPSRRARG